MDTKNVIAAISLSAAVIVLYSLFLQPDHSTIKKNMAEQKKIENNSDTPSIDKNENFTKLSREDSLKENSRIQFENGSVVGSISLKGATIDDLTFKEYNINLNGNEKITLLSPRNVEDGYLIESGFVSTNKNIDIPNASTVWNVSGNKRLTNNDKKKKKIKKNVFFWFFKLKIFKNNPIINTLETKKIFMFIVKFPISIEIG